MEKNFDTLKDVVDAMSVHFPPPPVTTIYIGKYVCCQIGVDKKFNWFQKKMMKWCFGWEVKEKKNDA